MLVSSCKCLMFVSCVHPVQALRAAFCMTCSLLMLIEDAIGDHMTNTNTNIFISINNDIANLYIEENYTNSKHSNNDDFNKSNDYKT